MTKLFSYLKSIILALILIIVLICNVNVYHPQYNTFEEDRALIEKQLNYLDWTVKHDGPAQMQRLYPEGAFFMYSLYSLSWIQYARRFDQENEESSAALEKAKWGIRKMEEEFGRFSSLKNLDPPYGIYMSGWTNWAKGSFNVVARKLGAEEYFEKEFQQGSKKIAEAFQNSSTHYLQSYYHGVWPSDNIIAIASLKLYDHLYEERYDSLINTWLVKVKRTQDHKTLMFPYASHPKTGRPTEGTRGNAEAIIIRFLAEIDPAYTMEQYKLYHEYFPRRFFGLTFTREIPKNSYGEWTVDSGPIIFEVGTAASIVAQIPYRIFHDHGYRTQLLGSINAMGFPTTYDKKQKYIFGQMPVADAFLVWGSLTKPYTQTYERLVLDQSDSLWAIWFHIYSLICSLILIFLLYSRKIIGFVSKRRSKK